MMATADSAAGEVVAAITDFVKAVNRGDQDRALALLTKDVSIVEDLAPYRWRGPTAGAEWLLAMHENAQANAITGIFMQLGRATRVEVEGEHAYVIVEGHLTYNGVKLLHSHGTLTFALIKELRGWLISAFAWTGPVASL
jgi:ketosteroid isomerase-like protein